ncbi:MAG: glucodextranase DOMON-like domain-containing protein, partial [Thermoflexales bacterium]
VPAAPADVDPATGLFASASARAIALGPLASLLDALAGQPAARITVATSPSLLGQMRLMTDPAVAARDMFWELGSRPSAALSADDKRTILTSFFGGRAPDRQARDERVFPRWKELRLKRDAALAGGLDDVVAVFSERDFRDLQVLYNLALFDPGALATPPLAALAARGGGWTEDDKRQLFEATASRMARELARLRDAAGAGQIELATLPHAEAFAVFWQGGPAYPYPADAERLFDISGREIALLTGAPPAGLVFRAGDMPAVPAQKWLAGRRSWILQGGETRAPESISGRSGLLPMPNVLLLDKTGGESLRAYAETIPAASWAVSLAQLGVPDDPETLLQTLADIVQVAANATPKMRARTVADGLGLGLRPVAAPAQAALGRGAVPLSAGLAAEIAQARGFVEEYVTGRRIASLDVINDARDMLLSATDIAFFEPRPDVDPEAQHRAVSGLLRRAYALLGAPAPEFLDAPLGLPRQARLVQGMTAFFTPTIDGLADDREWASAAYAVSGFKLPTALGDDLQALRFGMNARSLFIRVDGRAAWTSLAESPAYPARLGVYLQRSGASPSAYVTRVGGDGEIRGPLGFTATHLLEWTVGEPVLAAYAANSDGGWALLNQGQVGAAALGFGERSLEFSVPLDALGIESDATLALAAVLRRDSAPVTQLPRGAVAAMVVPDIGTPRLVGRFDDPTGDDHGPGGYVYPEDAVFLPGSYDLRRVTILRDSADLIFWIDLGAAIRNPWGSLIGLSIQTIDIYIDRDPGRGTGRRTLLEGRNAALPKGMGWETALWIEGWNQQLFVPDGETGVTLRDRVRVRASVDARGRVIVRAPLEALGEGDPARWGYSVVVLSQETYPSEGARRVRDIEPRASQWRLGGGQADATHTRIIDALLPAGAARSQELLLGTYKALPDGTERLEVDDLPAAPLVTIGPN